MLFHNLSDLAFPYENSALTFKIVSYSSATRLRIGFRMGYHTLGFFAQHSIVSATASMMRLMCDTASPSNHGSWIQFQDLTNFLKRVTFLTPKLNPK